MATKFKITIKDKENNTLYPKTLLEHVFNAAGTALSAILNAMNTAIDGKLGKTEKPPVPPPPTAPSPTAKATT